jgi:deoxycytidine triphosphate deaminase
MAVLTGPELKRRSLDEEPALIQPFADESCRGAAYDLRIARDGCVVPGGDKYPPGEFAPSERLVIEPGQTAFVSSLEILTVPDSLVGTISIKAKFSRLGIQLLTGLIIDPGYCKNAELKRDGRLHFGVVNLGSDPVELRLGQDAMVSVQFSTLDGDVPETPAVTGVDNIWDRDDLTKGYGFIGDLRDVGRDVRRLREDFERQRTTTEYVIVIAVLLLLATVFSFSLAALLSLAADEDFLKSVRRVVPDDPADRWFSLALLGIAAFGLAGVADAVRSKRARQTPSSRGGWRYQVADQRLAVRRRAWAYTGFAVAFLATAATAAILECAGAELDELPFALILPAVFSLGVGLTLFALPEATDKRLDDELKKIRGANG